MTTILADSFTPLLAETLAAHFPGARIEGTEVELGFGELRARCEVNSVIEHPGRVIANLFFWLFGGKLGSHPLFTSVSGIGAAAAEAVITGCCQWADAFGPMLRAALTDATGGEDIDFVDLELHGQKARLFIAAMDRCTLDSAASNANQMQRVRQLLGRDGWLLKRVVASAALPLLPAQQPSLLGLFCGEQAAGRTLEIKVNGRDWPAAARAFAEVPSTAPQGAVFLRELAVLVPQGPAPPLVKDVLERTLRGLMTLSDRESPRASVLWRGWRACEGELGAPLTGEQVAALEKDIGPLPDDYRHFVLSVAAAGAGPGYGLISPDSPGQRQLAAGEFPASSRDGEQRAEAHGALLLAHAGCNISWLLVLRGACRGQVWVEAYGRLRHVADSFSDWYRDWLAACVRDEHPWLHWDFVQCATPQMLYDMISDIEQQEGVSQMAAIRQVVSVQRPGSIVNVAFARTAFAEGETVDPCAGCLKFCTAMGFKEEAFGEGMLPLQARPPQPSPPPPQQPARRGIFARLFGR